MERFSKNIVLLDAAKAVPGQDLPGSSLTNRRLAELMEIVKTKIESLDSSREIAVSDENFPYDRVGISSRCILDEYFGAYDTALAACKKLLDGRTDLDKIKVIITATISPDKTTPNISSSLQNALGLSHFVQTLDIRIGCSGFLASLETAARILQSYPSGSMALVVGVDAMSRLMDASDRNTCIIFGDGGGAVLLGSADKENSEVLKAASYDDPWCFTYAESYTDGSRGDAIEVRDCRDQSFIYRFVSENGVPAIKEDYICKTVIHMDGRSVYKDMLRLVPSRINGLLKNLSLCREDIDLFLFHQANVRMIEAIVKIMHIPEEKLYNNIEFMGNTTDGCIPCLLADKLKSSSDAEKRAVITAFGTGYMLTAAYMERASLAFK